MGTVKKTIISYNTYNYVAQSGIVDITIAKAEPRDVEFALNMEAIGYDPYVDYATIAAGDTTVRFEYIASMNQFNNVMLGYPFSSSALNDSGFYVIDDADHFMEKSDTLSHGAVYHTQVTSVDIGFVKGCEAAYNVSVTPIYEDSTGLQTVDYDDLPDLVKQRYASTNPLVIASLEYNGTSVDGSSAQFTVSGSGEQTVVVTVVSGGWSHSSSWEISETREWNLYGASKTQLKSYSMSGVGSFPQQKLIVYPDFVSEAVLVGTIPEGADVWYLSDKNQDPAILMAESGVFTRLVNIVGNNNNNVIWVLANSNGDNGTAEIAEMDYCTDGMFVKWTDRYGVPRIYRFSIISDTTESEEFARYTKVNEDFTTLDIVDREGLRTVELGSRIVDEKTYALASSIIFGRDIMFWNGAEWQDCTLVEGEYSNHGNKHKNFECEIEIKEFLL